MRIKASKKSDGNSSQATSKKLKTMTKQVLKTVLAGILAGLLIFMMPFLIIKVLIFFFLIKAIFRLMGGRRPHWRYAYIHKYQNMSEDERKAFMQKYGNRCGWNSKNEESEIHKTDEKN